MSNKIVNTSGKRPYRQKARARRHEEVHQRITKAAVHLHGTVGPARTTMGEIARLAGVRRATVYNHFPSDVELIDACSSHWFSENPPPDPAVWAGISDPVRRVKVALLEMYSYFDQGRDMLGKVLRDSPLVPALAEIMHRKWVPLLEGIVDILAQGWEFNKDKDDENELRAILRVALDFFTWQTLTSSGLSNDKAAAAAAAWIETV